MGKKRIKTPLHLAEIVPAASDSAISMIPDDQAEVYLEKLIGNITQNKTATVCIVWDYGSENEEIIQIQDAAFKQFVGTGDGVKKIALVLSNLETSEGVAIGGCAVITELVEV